MKRFNESAVRIATFTILICPLLGAAQQIAANPEMQYAADFERYAKPSEAFLRQMAAHQNHAS